MNKIFTWKEQRYSITEEKPLILLPDGQVLFDDCVSTGINVFQTGNLTAKYKVSRLEKGITMAEVAKDLSAVLAVPVYNQ